MWATTRPQKQNYHAVADDDILDESQFPSSSEKRRSPSRTARKPWHIPNAFRIPLLVIGALSFLAILGQFSGKRAVSQPASNLSQAQSEAAKDAFTSPQQSNVPVPVTVAIPAPPEPEPEHEHPEHSRCPLRREWRALKRQEQQQYIDATLCLKSLYPVNPDLENNYTGYDDFPWIDAHHGYKTFAMASFLPWHRWFLHLYERALRQRCGYKGSLPYWDWTLDYENIFGSPVFDPDTGFGGDGVGSELTAGATGKCVIDGPYAGIQAEFWNGDVYPHCLSRGFRPLHEHGGNILPDSVEYILQAPDYEQFIRQVEDRVRDTIPYSIGGEFEASTASYDPLFFLHFTQLDRLWWLWQQRQDRRGLFSYGGQREPDSLEPATLEDELSFGGLWPKTVLVKDVLNTEYKDLCYRY